MLFACRQGRFTLGARMMQATESNRYWLVDGSALAPSEVDSLRHARQIRWLYDHVDDDQAMFVGPVLAAPCTLADQLAAQLQADEARAWAISTLCAQTDFDILGRHLAALRYLHTQDGQRYYLRHADSRCLTALWPVLTASQQRSLLGPVQRWSYTDRHMQSHAISLGDEMRASGADRVNPQLRLTDQQLENLLHRCWPDQLLYSVREQQPSAGHSLTQGQRYDGAQRVCGWLRSKREDRYPVQVETLKIVLSETSQDWDDAQWAAAIEKSYQSAVAAQD